MKIYISADIEGSCGVCHWDETIEKGADYNYFRNQMTKEVKACCEGLISCGITDIYVRDAHDSARNIDINQLPPSVKIIRNWSGGICSMMDGLDQSFDAVIYIGYHSPCRSDDNPLSHTQNTHHVEIKINNQIVSEYLLNSYYAQSFKVPVIMISGDQGICQRALLENPLVATVATKSGLHGAIVSKQPDLVVKEIKTTTIEAIKKLRNNPDKASYQLKIPQELTLEIQYRNHVDAYRASFYPGAHQISDDQVTFKTKDIKELFGFMLFCD